MPTPLPLTVACFMPYRTSLFSFFRFSTSRPGATAIAPKPTGQHKLESGYIVRGLAPGGLSHREVLPAPSPFEQRLAAPGAVPGHELCSLSACFRLFHVITGSFTSSASPCRAATTISARASRTSGGISIYWKDFMMKLFFFPMFSASGARVVGRSHAATLGVFAATWFLHVYQVFWMTRTIPFHLTDAGLWLGAGVIVVLNIQLELSRARRPAAPLGGALFFASLRRAVSVVGTFSLVSLFWACWNTPQVLPSVQALTVSQGFMQGGMGLLLAVAASASKRRRRCLHC